MEDQSQEQTTTQEGKIVELSPNQETPTKQPTEKDLYDLRKKQEAEIKQKQIEYKNWVKNLEENVRVLKLQHEQLKLTLELHDMEIRRTKLVEEEQRKAKQEEASIQTKKSGLIV